MLDNIKEKFSGNSYHLIKKNCNTFTNCFAEALLHKPIPSWINRMANIGKFFIESQEFLSMRPYNFKSFHVNKTYSTCEKEQCFKASIKVIMMGVKA